jgi:Ni,Fe-hydrogenase I large subunit
MTRIVIDPVTRIEGHLRIEVELDANNTVTDAWSSGTLWRGLEEILKGRYPQDAPLLSQRICGVCTYSHYEAATLALEHAYGVSAPKNARIIRNLIKAAQWLHDHPMHFYVLHGYDWFDVVSALSAEPGRAVELARTFSDNPYNSSVPQYEFVQQRLGAFMESGRLGLFAKGYWGHSAYRMKPEANLIMASHYLDLLEVQRTASRAMAVFGGKNPHPQSLIIGGVTSAGETLDPKRIEAYMSYTRDIKDFVERAYLADIHLVTSSYRDEAIQGTGAGLRKYVSYGCFPFSDDWSNTLFPAGVIATDSLDETQAFNPLNITEHVKHSWYEGEQALYPLRGETKPAYTGIDSSNYLDGAGKYSWVKAPRYNDAAMEVGPLARMLIGQAQGNSIIKQALDEFLKRSDLSFGAMPSTLGRTVARCLETVVLAHHVEEWTEELQASIQGGNKTFCNEVPLTDTASGYGLTDAPRGALGHWVSIENGRIANYQTVVPSTWNASPRDANGQRGAYEASLLGLTIADPDQPLEILRTVHSFDPCLACAVHIITPDHSVKRFKVV